MDNKKISTLLGTMVIVIFTITVSMFIWRYDRIINKNEAQNQVVVIPPRVSNDNIIAPVVLKNPLTTMKLTWKSANTADVIVSDAITWQEPTDLGDIGLTNKELYAGCQMSECGGSERASNGIKYLKVGTITSGKYKDAELIVIVSEVTEGPSILPNIARIIRKGDGITMLTKGLDEYMLNTMSADFAEGVGERTFDGGIVIEELNFPDKIEGENKRQILVRDEYGVAFFTDAKLKKVFMHPKYGQVWMTDSVKALDEDPTPFELNSYSINTENKNYHDIFGRDGFYIKAPDGTVVVYKMELDIFDKMERFGKLQATWNNGTKNKVDYEENPSGCGAGNYVYNKTAEINLNSDVVIVGKTEKGDNLYGYKDALGEELKKLYETTYQTEGEKKSIEEYLKMNPVVFWVDQFGRTLAFYRADLLSPAECGKPVIYLYPEKPMNVSVKVNPGNGLSYTEPEYNSGWNVFADTQSNLKNLADGKTYPYLFWEGSGGAYYEQPKQGFVVAKDNLNGFFDEKLAQLGLIEKEVNDFKEYWIPKMTNLDKPYYFVTFLSKSYIDALAPLTIEPKPETVIRVLMDYKGLDNSETVQPIKLSAPVRKGFTAVEWGGFLK